MDRSFAYRWLQRVQGIKVYDWSMFPLINDISGKSIAIVGNAGYLKDTNLGEIIDDYDLVVRMNSFEIYGFESCIGKKINFVFASFGRRTNLIPLCRTANYIFSSKPNTFFKDYASEFSLFSHRNGRFITRGLKKLKKKEGYAPSASYYAEIGKKLSAKPTTGFMSILFVIDYLSGVFSDVFISGFSFFEGLNHYFADDASDLGNRHNIQKEKQILAQKLSPLIFDGRVVVDEIMARHLDARN